MLQLIIKKSFQNDVETLCDALEDLGALSVTMIDQFDDPVLEPAPGATPLWPHVIIQALYEDEQTLELARESLEGTYPYLHYSVELVPDQDWERAWMADFKPLRFGQRLWICPTYQTPPEADAVNLMLDPGLAFGTGSHPTTALCLTWLDQAVLDQKSIIDYGCGSGILALAALKLGATPVFAVDIDPQALTATHNNTASNGIEPSQLTISDPEVLNEPVDILIANILLTPLLSLKNRFHSLLKKAGILVVSGLLADQIDTLISLYAHDFTHKKTEVLDGWGLVVFQR